MDKRRAQYYADNMQHIQKNERIFINNPVFITGLGLAPVVVAATTVQNAVILGLAMALLLTPTRILAAIFCRKAYYRLRGPIYALTAAVLYVGVSFLLHFLFGIKIQLVGIYLPLLVMEPLVIKRYERGTQELLKTAFRKGVITTAGFEIALFLVAAVREILAQGSLYGMQIFDTPLLPMAALVCGGFILVGLIAALWNSLISLFKKNVYKEAKSSDVD